VPGHGGRNKEDKSLQKKGAERTAVRGRTGKSRATTEWGVKGASGENAAGEKDLTGDRGDKTERGNCLGRHKGRGAWQHVNGTMEKKESVLVEEEDVANRAAIKTCEGMGKKTGMGSWDMDPELGGLLLRTGA